jgi:hypothetical protein
MITLGDLTALLTHNANFAPPTHEDSSLCIDPN